MAKSKRPRKAYRPKCEPGTLPIAFRMSAADERALHDAPRAALERMLAGTATGTDWQTLAAIVNVSAVMSDRFESIERLAAAALAAVLAIQERHARTGKYGLSGDEYRVLDEALDYADAMTQACTRREIRTDLLKTVKENEQLRRESVANQREV